MARVQLTSTRICDYDPSNHDHKYRTFTPKCRYDVDQIHTTFFLGIYYTLKDRVTGTTNVTRTGYGLEKSMTINLFI